MIFDDFIKMLAEINDLSDLNENNIIERIKTKLEENDLRRWENSGFDINHIFTIHSDPDPVKATLLHFAAEGGYENIVGALIARGADVNAQDNDGWTPLHYAAESDHENIVRALIVHGADVNARDNDRYTPLHCAAEWGCEGVVRILVANGADVNAQDNNGWTPSNYADREDHEDIVRFLLENGANFEPRAEMEVESAEQVAPAERLKLF
ncbi:ankyrin repeat domain-containing protein [Wolbachia endosymbiont of Aedes albopictus]|uniref:ankyrin repeat domain-containing protein n=1 Tax=Wolbachia endosymbiont of Aedes albopictus TaxID=167957 RepID=UPI000BBBA1F1|nr:ankyrin repeat domain-containing protein [Wolbachia endosymbiont of Aedes albopictus]UVW84327.1 ankyrin repeat domain-containing protein [Wolbachia endosymbiont of Aedes albopictus]